MFASHIFARGPELPQMPACLYEYVFGSNGIFVRAQRPGLEALIWVASTRESVRGLAEVKPYVRLGARVRGMLLARMFELAYRADGREILFYLSFNSAQAENPWYLACPEQVQGAASVHPVDPFAGGAQTMIEVHSHHSMQAFFSGTDNQEERSGFRIYTVLGGLNRKPEILTRVGIYGHFQEIPSSLVYEMPAGVVKDMLVDDLEDLDYDK